MSVNFNKLAIEVFRQSSNASFLKFLDTVIDESGKLDKNKLLKLKEKFDKQLEKEINEK